MYDWLGSRANMFMFTFATGKSSNEREFFEEDSMG